MSTLDFTRPRVASFPEAFSDELGREAVRVARLAGLMLDPWQAFVLENACGVREDEKWAAFEVGVNVPRQNGKGSILEARALAGLFAFGERYIIWSAHNFDTSKESFIRVEDLIRETPELHAQVAKYRHSHGEEGIELLNGARIRFRTRTTGGGKGFTADCVIFDEAMFLNETFHWALLPTLSAKSITGNPQVWYTGSAADQLVHEHAIVWARVRERGLTESDPSLAYFEYSLEHEDVVGPEDVTASMAVDEDAWAQANPAMGIRIAGEHIGHEQRSMDPRGFAVERLGVGDWPRTDGMIETVIRLEDWLTLEDAESVLEDPVYLAFDVSPDRSRASIAAAGMNQHGMFHVEIVDYLHGTAKVVERLLKLEERHSPEAIVCDGHGPVASLLEEAKAEGLKVKTVTATEHAQACGRFVDAVAERTLRHLGSAELTAAIRGARTRTLGDAWAWSRKSSAIDLTPLVSATLAAGEAIASTGAVDWTIHF